MNAISSYLEQLELLPLESKIYLTLFEAGSLTARELTQKLGVGRTTVYPPIDALIEKELIIKLVKDGKTQFAVTDPKHSLSALLNTVVAKKKQEVKDLQEILPAVINNLERPYSQQENIEEAEIKYYKGKLGVKKIYEELLKAKEVRSYVNMEEILEIFPENAKLFDKASTDNREMKMFEIVEDSTKARERVKTSNKSKTYFYKFFPDNVKITSTDVLIYDGKVSFINLKDQINGVTHYNRDLFNNFKILFDLLWKMLPE